MSKIDVSIWGIRAGFEDGGIFHSHNFAEVKELQKDKFRGLADLSRPKNSYMINRTVAHTVVTIIHTDIFEFSVSGTPRSGYIAISLIFDKNKALASSPKSFLQQFVQWYKQVQGNTRVNNFTAEQIQGIVNQLTLVDSMLGDVPGKKAIAYSNETELDEHLTGGSKYVPFEETIFYDPTINFAQSGLKNELIPIATVIDSVEKEEEKRRIEEEQNSIKKQQITEKELVLSELSKLGRIDEMIEVFDKFQYNFSLSPSIRNEVETVKQRRAEAIQSQEERRKAEEISRLINEGNLVIASAKYETLRDRSRLSEQEHRLIATHKSEVRRKSEKERMELEKAEKTARKKKAFKIYSIVGVFALLVSLSVFSFVLKIPLSFYDADGDKIANSEDPCPNEPGELKGCPDSDKDGIIDSEDDCPNDFGKLNGCPDSDKDGLTDKEEEQKGTNPKEKDTDGDSVNDKEDDCPIEKGIKENNGCKKVGKVREEPEPVVTDDSDNQLVVILFKGEKYQGKKGFTTKTGLAFGSPGSMPFYRFEGGKLLKKEPDGTKWKEVTNQKDITFFLKSNNIKKIAPSSNETVKPTNPTGGSVKKVDKKNDSADPNPPSNKKEKPEFSNKERLRNMYNSLKDKESLTSKELRAWNDLFEPFNKNRHVYKEDSEIDIWDSKIRKKDVEKN